MTRPQVPRKRPRSRAYVESIQRAERLFECLRCQNPFRHGSVLAPGVYLAGVTVLIDAPEEMPPLLRQPER